MIEEYLNEFERWIAGSKVERLEKRRELEAHLQGADQAGELEAVIKRLGSPRDAARAFASAPPPAPLGRRFAAAAVDYGLLVAGILGASAVAATRGWTKSGPHVNMTGSDFRDPLAFVVVGILAASLGYFILGNLLLEWRTGRTAGKALMGLRAVSRDGIALSFGQTALRRLPLVFSGPLQVVDWAFVWFNPDRQRAFDKVAGTIVTGDPLLTGHAPLGHTSSA